MVGLSATPAQSEMNRKLRVLCVYGSESGNAKRGIDRWVKKWSKMDNLKFEVVETLTGNEVTKRIRTTEGNAAAANLEFLVQSYDVLLFCTSSYGDGDPPSNMRELTKVLSHEASMKSDGLVGMHHAVLGFGSSTYPTFQNIPRLTDKWLGECGSRRLVQRAEIDEHDPNPGDEADYKRWGEEVFAALQSLPPASTPPACAWTVPGEKIKDPDEEDDGDEPLVPTVYVVASVIFAAASVAYHYLVGF